MEGTEPKEKEEPKLKVSMSIASLNKWIEETSEWMRHIDAEVTILRKNIYKIEKKLDDSGW